MEPARMSVNRRVHSESMANENALSCAHTCIHTQAHTHSYKCMNVHWHIHMHVQTQACTHSHTYMHAHTGMCTCMHTQSYTNACSHNQCLLVFITHKPTPSRVIRGYRCRQLYPALMGMGTQIPSLNACMAAHSATLFSIVILSHLMEVCASAS